MAEFLMKIAGHTAKVTSLFESTPQYFRNYLSAEPPEFSVAVSREDLDFEQAELLAEALRDGFKPRVFTDPFLERAAIQRAFAEFLFDRNVLLLHGSLVALDGEGYLFAARSGTGKSTHTRLWKQVFGDRAVIVNDDKPFFCLSASGVTAYGSPWSGKHGLDSNLAVPLKSICLLERGSENHICPTNEEVLLPILLAQGYCPQGKAREYDTLLRQLCTDISLYRMACNRDPEAAIIACAAMGGAPTAAPV